MKDSGTGHRRKKERMSLAVLLSVGGVVTVLSTFAAEWVAKLMGFLNQGVQMLGLGIKVTGAGIVAAAWAIKAGAWAFPKWFAGYKRFLSDKGLEPAWIAFCGVLAVALGLTLGPLAGTLPLMAMAFRCQICGRPITRKIKTPADRMPFCNGAERCDKVPLPRCAYCGSLYKPDKAGNVKYDKCDLSKRAKAHLWTLDPIRGGENADRATPADLKKVVPGIAIAVLGVLAGVLFVMGSPFALFVGLGVCVLSIRCVVASDDDIDIAGNALADADFWDRDDGETDSIEKVDPVLRDIIVWENSTTADATNRRTRGEFQPNVWPNTKRLLIWGARQGGIFASEAASVPVGVGTDVLEINGAMNLPLNAGFDWISDNTKLYSSVDNASVTGAMFVYQYGTAYPYKGGKMQWVRKVADAAESAADAFYTAWSTDFTGVSPGLDPDKTYVMRGIAHEAAATGKGGIGAFAQPQASALKLFGPCWGDFAMCVTIFMHDGILVDGEDGLTARTASATAADTPYVWLGFEEYEVGAKAKPGTVVEQIGGGVSAVTPTPALLAPALSRPGGSMGDFARRFT